jgi:hypothetical protein
MLVNRLQSTNKYCMVQRTLSVSHKPIRMEVLAQRGLDVHFSGISFCLDGAKNHISLHCIFFPKALPRKG